MVRHIVLFQFIESLTPQAKDEVYNRFKRGIEALPEQIPFIRHIYVGRNVNPAETWDICLNGDFDTLEDVVAYGQHPLHLAVSGELKPYLKGRSCVDYEY